MAANIGQHGLPSPIGSINSPAPSIASTVGGRPELPSARKHPLKPGSPKEIALINYIDDKMLRISRRYGKKFAPSESDKDDAPGYMTLDQVLEDIEPLIDLAWVSRTPTLQIPYLLSFAGTITSYMEAFTFTTAMFRILKKLDMAFSSLLRKETSDDTHVHTVSGTEKVRIKSLAEQTRMTAVQVASKHGHSTQFEYDSDDDDDGGVGDDDDKKMDVTEDDEGEEDESVAMAISKIYQSTITILGDALV